MVTPASTRHFVVILELNYVTHVYKFAVVVKVGSVNVL